MGLKDFTGLPGNPSHPGGSGIPSGTPMPGQYPAADMIDPEEYLINYNQKFAQAGTILFRDEVIQQTLSVLIGKNKPNALLIGQAGVGKTKIVEDIAYRIANNDPLIPDKLKGCTIYELPLSNIVANSGIVGELEAKTKAIIEFIEDPKTKAILFIDEIHQLVDGSQTYQKIAQIFKPALARGDMRVIGATTLQEAGDLTEDPAFNRRFSRIIVDELTRTQTVEILKHAKAGFFTHYSNKISIDDQTLETVAVLADQYKTAGNHRPDNALTLLDRTIGDAIVNRKVQEIKAANDPTMLQAIKSMPIIPITEKQIRKTGMRLMTGNSQKETLDMQHLTEILSVIKGQDDILESLKRSLKRHDIGLYADDENGNVPLTFLFVGPSGVGKTEITKIIAKELTGQPPIILDMTEYHSSASINRIIGAPAGYVGSDSHAELPFDALESNPYQVILLDEFEKGDKAVQTLFMGAFENGYIKTSKGKIVDFSKSIIIATSNAAHKTTTAQLGFCTNSTQSKASMVNDLSAWFDTALLNRFTEILRFHEIDKDTYREILINRYHKDLERIRKSHPRIALPDDIPDDELNNIIETTYVPAFGARPAKKAVQNFIEGQIIP